MLCSDMNELQLIEEELLTLTNDGNNLVFSISTTNNNNSNDVDCKRIYDR